MTLSVLTPIPGQPGLFRSRSLSGLGALSTDLSDRAQALQTQYVALKADVQNLLLRFPAPVESTSFADLARRIVAVRSPSGYVRLTGEQVASLLKASLSVIGNNIGIAYAMAGAEPSTVQKNAGVIGKLLDTASRVITADRALVDGLRTAEAASDAAARAAGLGVAVGDDIIAALILGAVALVAVYIVSQVVYAIFSAVNAQVAADRACQEDQAAGRSCTGADREAYRQRALEQSQQYASGIGNLCSLAPELCRSASNVILWGGLAVVGGLLAYGYWVSAPAARETRDYLHDRVRRRRAA